MQRRVLCSGLTVEGRECRQVRLDVEGPWYCHAHRAQDGQKRLVSATLPGWIKHPGEDVVVPEWTL